MTRQERIDWGLRAILGQLFEEYEGQYLYTASKQVREYLVSEGCVLKVDRELPERTWVDDWGGESGKAGYEFALEDMDGFVAVEPLIGGTK